MSFFKAYDMRGTFGEDFDLALVRRIGRELPAVLNAANGDAPTHRAKILVGRDARLTGEAVRDALVAGLAEAGAEVVDAGLATTPMIYFFTAEDGFDGGVMITASHNPPTDNGLKVSRRAAIPMGYDSGLAELERKVRDSRLVARDSCSAPPPASHEPRNTNHVERYISWLRERAPDFAGLRFAVDCSDGVSALFAHELFPNATILNDVPDGAFPHHAPNPLLAEAREQLADAVRRERLDCGIIFDGDGDRCAFVDERGEFIQPDFLLPFVAAECLRDATPRATSRDSNSAFPPFHLSTFPPPLVVHDVRTSRAAIEALRAMGCRTLMGKVGHAFAKKAIRETGAICGGELAGHYYFREFHGCDSGALAALKLLGAFARAKKDGQSVSEFLAPVTRKYANSGELNFRVNDKPAAIARIVETAQRFGEIVSRSDLDGVRLEFADGWVSVRQSNTEPYLRLIVECENSVLLATRQEELIKSLNG